MSAGAGRFHLAVAFADADRFTPRLQKGSAAHRGTEKGGAERRQGQATKNGNPTNALRRLYSDARCGSESDRFSASLLPLIRSIQVPGVTASPASPPRRTPTAFDHTRRAAARFDGEEGFGPAAGLKPLYIGRNLTQCFADRSVRNPS